MWNGIIHGGQTSYTYLSLAQLTHTKFYINKPLRNLSAAVLYRLQITGENITYLLFASRSGAQQCITSFNSSPQNKPAISLYLNQATGPGSQQKHLQPTSSKKQ